LSGLFLRYCLDQRLSFLRLSSIHDNSELTGLDVVVIIYSDSFRHCLGILGSYLLYAKLTCVPRFKSHSSMLLTSAARVAFICLLAGFMVLLAS
jgi:hypothetical protein